MSHVLEQAADVPVRHEARDALAEVVEEADRVPEKVGGTEDEDGLGEELVLVMPDDRISEEVDRLERVDPDEDGVSLLDVELLMTKILRKWSDVTELVPIGDRWRKGTMILKPFDRSMKEKEIPVETFFHKIVMLRDRLRVMEQRINSNKTLSDAEKVDLQQYITRIYGSLTTFNVLFKNKEDQFRGESSRR